RRGRHSPPAAGGSSGACSPGALLGPEELAVRVQLSTTPIREAPRRPDVRLPPPADPLRNARREFAQQMVEEARATGVNLVGTGGLLTELTKRVLESGLEVEMTEHLGYEKHAVEGRDGGNSRNGTRGKTILTDISPVEPDVP